MIGELYARALAGRADPDIEYSDGRRVPLRAARWLRLQPGDASLLRRCAGSVLDVGSGPGRLTVALAGRGLVALGIDVDPYAVALARSAGAFALRCDVFADVPGRWDRVLLADGNIGIGGDPAALLRRARQLLTPGGRVLVELDPPGTPMSSQQVRLRHGDELGGWFAWAHVAADRVAEVAGAGWTVDVWTEEGRWFAELR
ncbi:class I SAM-dependent methyltransferase [Streptosporangiaceae bacterium NEAU-GS5]|nr:class I SAM-dependent methyltransferase [Streptosporangiaceae bacterium NEAU-GS5]